ncbi:MAG: hypothetical protein ACKV1O_15865 [Saprospiraceae bacterium]
MLRFFFYLLFSIFFFSGLNAQTDVTSTERLTQQQLSPADADLLKETNEVANFARKLAALKTAFVEKNMSQIVANEAYILLGMREEIDQMTAKAMTAAAQVERRKTATSGQITPAAKPEEAPDFVISSGKPSRDPFAEATTPTEIRLEKMTYTMAAFERHAFDPAQPEAAAKDFARLDAFLSIMQEELGELKKLKE